MTQKTFYLSSLFEVKEKSADQQDPNLPEEDFITIKGFANTTDKDRVGDIIIADAWKQGGLDNYLKNPVILAFHDHSQPIGTMTDFMVSDKGLEITAKISKYAEETFNLIKAGVLKAFSVGIRIKDAKYIPEDDTFYIKDLELMEVSVVSVPANQNCIFNVSKSFENAAELSEFKKQFSATPVEQPEDTNEQLKEAAKEKGTKPIMDKTELEQIIKAATQAAAESAVAAVKAATPAPVVEVGESGAEKLIKELQAKFEDEKKSFAEAISGLQASLRDKSEEIAAIAKSKMEFASKSADDSIAYADKETAVLLAKALGRKVEDTKFGKSLVEKSGAHVASAKWEDTVSTNLQEEIRRRLIVAPLFRQIAMPTPTLQLPVNPEAGYGTWVTSANYGTTASSGSAATHQLKEITLTSYKLATKEWIANEEEEDAILALMPIIRDAVTRRVSKSVDKALLRGAGSGGDPLKGITLYEASTANVTNTTTSAVSVAKLRTLRQNLGTWGLNPSDLIYIVSNDVYYDLLEDTNFMTMDKAGPNATLFTGQIGQVNGSPVILSGEFAAKTGGTAGSIGAVCINTNNFLVGNQRGLRVETDYLTEMQSRILVASLRMAFQQISTVDGQGVSCLRWT